MAEFQAADGTRIHYVDEGQGQPVVFVHGWMMSHACWQPQLAHFRDDHRVVALDLRGCGRSEDRAGTHDMAHYADDLLALLSHLELRDTTVVGWSMGGGVTMEALARDRERRIARVGLVDFPPRLEEDPSVADKVCANLSTKPESFTRSFIARMFLTPPAEETLAPLVAEALRCSAATACEMYRAMRPSRGESVGPLPQPAYLAFPEQGWFPKALPAWRTILPDHVAPAFARSKHCPFLEEPDHFNASLRGFLAARAPVGARPTFSRT